MYFSILLPLAMLLVLTLTILIIICVYLKEHVKSIKHYFKKGFTRSSRPDKDYENEMLRREFANGMPDHIELQEEGDDEDHFASKNSKR